jgi:Protein of unknown function (DUF2408)
MPFGQRTTLHKPTNPGKELIAANEAYKKRLRQLKHEEQRLTKCMDNAWSLFDNILQPLWKMDDTMTAIHQHLAEILKKLEYLNNASYTELSSSARSQQLRDLQDELHKIEEDHPIEGGKFITGPQVERGQAMTISLLNRCYKLTHHIVENEPDVDESLQETYSKLKALTAQLCVLRYELESGFEIDPNDIVKCQQQADEIDSARVNQSFTDDQGNIPEGADTNTGQAILKDELERAFDLIHECTVLLEEKETETPETSDTDFFVKFRDELAETFESHTEKLSKAGYTYLVEPLAEKVTELKEMAKSYTPRLHSALSRYGELI